MIEALQEFEQYMAHLSEGLGHADRHAGLRGYCTGLMSPLSRKSVEPMAAQADPLKVRSRHQSLHHFVADANWSDEQMLLRVCHWVVPLLDFSDGGWWIIDMDLKQDLGLGHYEGRGWRGFHHHASLSIAAYGFLLAQRLPHPDESGGKKTPHNARSLPCPRITNLGAAQRAQRHDPSSITRLRMRIGSLLAQNLPRCRCCLRVRERLRC